MLKPARLFVNYAGSRESIECNPVRVTIDKLLSTAKVRSAPFFALGVPTVCASEVLSPVFQQFDYLCIVAPPAERQSTSNRAASNTGSETAVAAVIEVHAVKPACFRLDSSNLCA